MEPFHSYSLIPTPYSYSLLPIPIHYSRFANPLPLCQPVALESQTQVKRHAAKVFVNPGQPHTGPSRAYGDPWVPDRDQAPIRSYVWAKCRAL